MAQATLTENGTQEVREFFDSIFGAGEYDLDIGIQEVLESVEASLQSGESMSHEVTDLNGCPRELRLYEGDDFTI